MSIKAGTDPGGCKQEKFAGSKGSTVAEVSKLLNSASLSASELEACPAEGGGGSDPCEQTAPSRTGAASPAEGSDPCEHTTPSMAGEGGALCEEPVVL